MIVIAVVILLLVFVMFSLDEQEEEMDFLQEELAEAEDNTVAEVETVASKEVKVIDPPKIEPQEESVSAEPEAKTAPAISNSSELLEPVEYSEIGSEEDLRFRLNLSQRLSLPTYPDDFKGVVAAVQIRFPEEVLDDKNKLIKNISAAEELFEKEFSFSYEAYRSTQLNQLWFFDESDDRDDALFEALVVAFEVVSRFKKSLERNDSLREAKARVSVGLSKGQLLKVNRGDMANPSWIGKPAYMAETLAEAAGDFSIYVDQDIHKSALPLFDFREWKPIKLRSPLPAIPLFELVGWNKPDEIAKYASHEDSFSRKAVAIAYRYLDLDDHIQPLLGLLSDTDEKVAMEALETIRVIGTDTALGLLKRIFPEAQEPKFRSAIIDAFGSIGNSGVLPVILGSTKEGSWKVRYSAARTLYMLSKKDALKHLEELLEDKDGAVRAAVNSIFYKETAQAKYLSALTELLTDISSRARKAAADELLKMDTEKTIGIITKSFKDQELELQKHILRQLEFSRCKILYQCFLTIFKNSDERTRTNVLEAVRRAQLVS
jgi:HEAT repeat protein